MVARVPEGIPIGWPVKVAATSAVHASGQFERRRRDLTTASAHMVGQRRAFQTAGQLLFGDDVPTFV